MIPIKTDSRKVKPNDTFVAIKGLTVDGHDYIDKAILNGATKVVVEKEGNYPVETIVVKDTKEWLQQTIVKNYQEEIKKLTLIGVTGTNGKTTTCFLTYQTLKELGIHAAYIGTIGFWYDDVKRELPNTTPEILEIYSMLIEAIEHKITHVVMEVSSHSLHQKRIEGLQFQIACFTNLTEDHLDYHKTMEEYLHAKLKIVDALKENGTMIYNIDDPYGHYFATPHSKSLGFSGKDYQIVSYENTKEGTTIECNIEGEKFSISTNLRSKFNVYNYLMSVAILNELSFPLEDILFLSKTLFAPKGRCEQIKVGESEAVIDYAHTPDAVEKIIDAFLENKKGKIYTIIGCGGDRDPIKRPIMGEIATSKSDYVIFTSDNPRTEDPLKILEDIIKGVSKNNYEIEPDRKKAIKKGLSLLKKDDVLLILGKGHEDYQIIGHEKIHFDDAEEVRKYQKEME